MSHADPGPSRSRARTRTESHTRPLTASEARAARTARYKDRPQLGHMASWAVSSHKYGYGVDNLRDGSETTYWQSEGPQPHLIDLSFPRRVMISAVSILTSHRGDDSYTPSKIAVQCGTTVHDLQEVRVCDFNQPDGWQHIALRPMDSSEREIEGPPISAFHLRIIILANHLNGKDTHIRGVKVFGAPAGSVQLLAAAAAASALDSGEGDAVNEDEDESSDEGEEEDEKSEDERTGADERGRLGGMGMEVGDETDRFGTSGTGTGIGTGSSANGMDKRDQDKDNDKDKEQRKKEREMRRLLKMGGPDKVGYTTRAFKMHECIR